MTFPPYGVNRDFNFFYRECAIFILPASQVECLSVSKILSCICPILSPSVLRYNRKGVLARNPGSNPGFGVSLSQRDISLLKNILVSRNEV